MKVYVASPSGYCQGVQRALALALSFKNKYKNKKIYVLGSLVHNENVINELSSYGIYSLNENISNEEKIKKLEDNSYLIFSAHGHDKKLEEICKRKNITFLDATCPIVSLTAKNINDALKNNHQVIYVGAKNHPEVKSMLSLSDNVYLYDDIKENIKDIIKDSSPFVSNQTTLSIYELDDIFNKIKNIFPNAIFQNEICNETRIRQLAIKKLPNDVDVVFIIGGKESSNTLKLYNLAKSYFTTLKIFRILDVNDINENKIKGCLSAALISGASTPLKETMKIKSKLEDLW